MLYHISLSSSYLCARAHITKFYFL